MLDVAPLLQPNRARVETSRGLLRFSHHDMASAWDVVNDAGGGRGAVPPPVGDHRQPSCASQPLKAVGRSNWAAAD